MLSSACGSLCFRYVSANFISQMTSWVLLMGESITVWVVSDYEQKLQIQIIVCAGCEYCNSFCRFFVVTFLLLQPYMNRCGQCFSSFGVWRSWKYSKNKLGSPDYFLMWFQESSWPSKYCTGSIWVFGKLSYQMADLWIWQVSYRKSFRVTFSWAERRAVGSYTVIDTAVVVFQKVWFRTGVAFSSFWTPPW